MLFRWECCGAVDLATAWDYACLFVSTLLYIQRGEERRDELFRLISRVRSHSGGELVLRQQLAVQRQQLSSLQAAYPLTDDAENPLPNATPTHHHSDCDDALVTDIFSTFVAVLPVAVSGFSCLHISALSVKPFGDCFGLEQFIISVWWL